MKEMKKYLEQDLDYIVFIMFFILLFFFFSLFYFIYIFVFFSFLILFGVGKEKNSGLAQILLKNKIKNKYFSKVRR